MRPNREITSPSWDEDAGLFLRVCRSRPTVGNN
jgi:hypothetical protein